MKLSDLKCISDNLDLDEYIRCRELVKDSMIEPSWLGDFSKSKILQLLEDGAKIWMYYKDGDFVSSMMLIPADDKAMNRYSLEIDYTKVVDYGPMFVNPKYQGNSLQYQMLKYLDMYASNLGYEYAIVTIHPDNIYSINNILKDGFTLSGTKEFTRGVRNIYLKTL